MDISASIADQWVRGFIDSHPDWLADKDEGRRASAAFVLLCAKAVLDLDDEEAMDCLTEGGQDGGIDALHVDDVKDGEFLVTLFQGKYRRDLTGSSPFPSSEIQKLLATIGGIFDPESSLPLHAKLLARVEEIRSLGRDGHVPQVRVVLCNNGQRWDSQGEAWIQQLQRAGGQVSFTHINHEWLIQMRKRKAQVSDTLSLSGLALVEDHNFRRVLIGKVPVSEIRALFERHGDRLLERNIRRYLGMGDNRVNQGIAETLKSRDKRSNFYFYNNGLTMACSNFRYNALQGRDYRVQVEDMQILNGGQTCKTIQHVLKEMPEEDFSQTYVLLRLYAVGDKDDGVIEAITYATNSQSLVDLRDLRANDEVQQQLELGLRELGFEYKRKREAGAMSGPETIPSSVAAEAVFAIWRHQPHVARLHRGEMFGRFYPQIFSRHLNAAQVACPDVRKAEKA